jgi:hypothetical protein
MCVRLLKNLLIMVGVSFLFITCSGELDTVFPSAGTYQVNAFVGKSSLDESSVITAKDTIRPFFSNSVTNDPDITGLMVFLQGPDGKIVGGKVQYTLKPADSAINTNNINNTKTESGVKTVDETNFKDTLKEDSSEMPEEGKIPGRELADTGSLQEVPKRQDSSLTPAESSILDSLIHVTRLDRDLPYFPLPKNLEVGLYTMAFQVLGDKGILYRIDRPVYYIGSNEFNLDDIRSYLPGISAGGHLVPPGLTIMLETQVSAGEKLDPYIIWYNGKKRIYEGSIAEGAGRFLWKAPEQTGFHTLRAEAFPFKPVPDLNGKTKELSLPVSAKQENTGAFSKKADQFICWYQFSGDLRDSKAPAETNRAVLGNRPVRWLPMGTIYGLAIGPGEVYQLPLAPFTHFDSEEQGVGQFLLRFKPVSEGTIFTALFKGDSAILDMTLSVGKQGLILSLNAEENSAEIPMFIDSLETETFITTVIDFRIEANCFTASLSLENSGRIIPKSESLLLSATLSGAGTFQLGDSRTPRERDIRSTENSDYENFPDKNDETATIVIFDEFAALYRVAPLSNGESVAPEFTKIRFLRKKLSTDSNESA